MLVSITCWENVRKHRNERRQIEFELAPQETMALDVAITQVVAGVFVLVIDDGGDGHSLLFARIQPIGCGYICTTGYFSWRVCSGGDRWRIGRENLDRRLAVISLLGHLCHCGLLLGRLLYGKILNLCQRLLAFSSLQFLAAFDAERLCADDRYARFAWLVFDVG
jgi:hypothetical protein